MIIFLSIAVEELNNINFKGKKKHTKNIFLLKYVIYIN